MGPNLYDAWYLVVGILLANGIPHFVFGRAGKIFRSPFGQRSAPNINVGWGVSNFVVAFVIGIALAYLNLYDSYSLLTLFVGFFLVVLMFGTRIRRFLNEA